MKRTAIIFILLASFVGGILWYGSSLPELSHNSASHRFNRSPEYIWQLIFDYQRYPEWRENVYSVEKTPGTLEHDAWKEIDADGITTPFKLIKADPNIFIIIEETGRKPQNSGKWHFEITAGEDGKSSTLKITEDRPIISLVPRVINHLLNTSTSHINTYFHSIENKIMGDILRAKRNKKQPPVNDQAPTDNKNEVTP